MTQEEKDLLLRDLCSRLPYGVKFSYKYIDACFREKYGTSTLEGVLPPYRIMHSTLVGDECLQIERDEVKPYLFPISSMTEEQRKEMHNYSTVIWDNSIDSTSYENRKIYCAALEIEWLDKNHFDYRGLIPLGLAKDATNLNIY